ncbi:MAG: hypothetical protein IME98_03670, partial [Proteobacteria bacterium]|nr:hypothetical protein [Pseudomonadota bacterium]
MDSNELQAEKKKAEELFLQGRYHDAKSVYDALRKFADKDPVIFVRLGDIATKLDDDFLAMDNYKKAAQAFSKVGAAIKAIAICKKILSLHPSRTHVEDSLAALSSNLKSSKERAQKRESRRVATLARSKAEDITEPLIHISADEFVDADLVPPMTSSEMKGEPVNDDFDDFDDFIEDYIEIVEHVGEDSLSIDNDNAKDRGLKRTPLFSDLSIDELMGVICKLNVCFV